MNNDYIQIIRYKLQKKVKRLNTTSSSIFHYENKKFLNFINSTEIIYNIVSILEVKWQGLKDDISNLMENKIQLAFDNEEENAAAGYLLIKACSESQDVMKEIRIGISYGKSQYSESMELFRELFIEPLYEYIDEHLDDSRNLLSFLLHYKRSVEWFKKDKIFTVYNEHTQIGETILANNLYEYLYDQGINFYIEPKIETGRIDLISDQVGDERLLIDAKIYDPDNSRGNTYLAKGFNQIITYLHEYNESIGYLVIFQTGGKNLNLDFREKENKIPFIQFNNKIVFFIHIDIRKLESASRRGVNETIILNEEEFIKKVEE
jgi:hypothetical protein